MPVAALPVCREPTPADPIAPARDRLAAEHRWLVKAVVAPLASRGSLSGAATAEKDLDDLTQWGTVGLLEAAALYALNGPRVKFTTFAKRFIRRAAVAGECSSPNGVRLPKHARAEARDYRAAADRVRARHGCEPDPKLVTRAMGLTGTKAERVRGVAALLAASRVPAGALESAPAPETGGLAADDREGLVSALRSLPDSDWWAVSLRYGLNDLGGERTVEDVGAVMGLSKTRAGQILRRALGRLKAAMGER